MDYPKNKNSLIEEKLALSVFFDSLLHESDVYTSDSIIDTRNQQQSDVIQTNVTKLKLPSFPLPTPVPLVDEPGSKVEDMISHEKKNISESESLINNNKIEPFQILMFNIAGLNLAVPLVELSGVLEWPDTVTEMPGHATFFLGLVQHHGHQVPIIDLAQIIFPEEKLSKISTKNRLHSINKIVLIDNAKWGLACDSVQQVLKIEPEQVRWRVKQHTRRWLAGTVIDHMCALLDSTQLAELLCEGYRH